MTDLATLRGLARSRLGGSQPSASTAGAGPSTPIVENGSGDNNPPPPDKAEEGKKVQPIPAMEEGEVTSSAPEVVKDNTLPAPEVVRDTPSRVPPFITFNEGTAAPDKETVATKPPDDGHKTSVTEKVSDDPSKDGDKTPVTVSVAKTPPSTGGNAAPVKGSAAPASGPEGEAPESPMVDIDPVGLFLFRTVRSGNSFSALWYAVLAYKL